MSSRAVLRAAAACAVAGVVLCGCNLGLSQNAVIVDTDSTSATIAKIAKIPPFTVTGAWQIKYNFDCTKANSQGVLDSNVFTVYVLNGDDNSTAFEHPATTFVSVKRQGTLNFTKAGDYYLHIFTECDWTLQVIDLSSGPVTSTTVAQVAQPHGTVTLDVAFASEFGSYTCSLTGAQASLCAVGDGTSARSPFGPLTMHRTVAYAAGGAGCVSASTRATLTAANGDVLGVASKTGQLCHKGVDSFTFAVTGGTGIFKGATGSGTITDAGGTSDHWKATIAFPNGRRS